MVTVYYEEIKNVRMRGQLNVIHMREVSQNIVPRNVGESNPNMSKARYSEGSFQIDNRV